VVSNELTQADKHVIESLIVHVRTWRECAPTWSWKRAGEDLQRRCAELLGEVRANEKYMIAVGEIESLLVRLYEIGEHIELLNGEPSEDDYYYQDDPVARAASARKRGFVSEVLGNEPDDIDEEWRGELAKIDEVVGAARTLRPDKPLESDGIALETYKNYKIVRAILESAYPSTVKDRDVYDEMLKREMLDPKVRPGTFDKRIQRGRKELEGARATRHDKIKASRILLRKPITYRQPGEDEDFHDYGE